jgi:oligopeptide/dipeptide ABC transporter ATP-binding protein
MPVSLTPEPLLALDRVSVTFRGASGPVAAVRDISFDLKKGETLGLVGESGCGKSLTALAIMGLLPSEAGLAGTINLNGQDLIGLPDVDYRKIRGARIAMVFQEPMTALNPVMTIGGQIAEVMALHQGLGRHAALNRAVELLDAVHIPDPHRRAGDYPHQLSGGMRQRVMIAIALAGSPDVLIADEPTTALDVTIQAQIIDLIRELQQKTGMALLFISHNLALVGQLANRVAVMYGGRIVESGPSGALFGNPLHPYTQGLLETLPDLTRRVTRLPVIPGMVPELGADISGCRFHPRCRLADEACHRHDPAAADLGQGRMAACLKVNSHG